MWGAPTATTSQPPLHHFTTIYFYCPLECPETRYGRRKVVIEIDTYMQFLGTESMRKLLLRPDAFSRVQVDIPVCPFPVFKGIHDHYLRRSLLIPTGGMNGRGDIVHTMEITDTEDIEILFGRADTLLEEERGYGAFAIAANGSLVALIPKLQLVRVPSFTKQICDPL